MKNKRKISCQLLAFLISVFTANVLQAQWNTNTFENLLISGSSNADMESASTTDGKTWIAFFSQNGGNYDMRAQLIDANGYKLLGADGILVSNQTSGSATYVFNVCVDASNNLIIACQDMRSGSMQAVLYKLSQTGAHLWNSTGIILGEGLAPYPAVLSTGEVVVAWNQDPSNTLNIQKITTTGTLAWATPIPVMVGTSNTTRGQVIANTGGKFTLVYQKMGVGISTTLYAQMFTNSGTALYAPLQICNETTSGARYYSIAADNDITFVGYYSSSGFRFNSFLQRIEAAGTLPWGINGSNFNTLTGTNDNYQGQTDINLTPGSSYLWSVCNFSNPSQSQYGIYIQKFNKTTGQRMFTDLAKVVFPVSDTSYQHSGQLALVSDEPMFLFYDDDDKIFATRLDANGNFAWPDTKVVLSSTTSAPATPKMRFGFTPDGADRCAGMWTEDRGSGYLGYAQGISIGGLIGIHVATQGNVPAIITTPGGTLQMVDTIFPITASQNVTWSIITGTGNAAISTSGLVTAITNGTVFAKATAVQDPTMKDSLMITISGQVPLAPTVVTLAATNVTTTSARLNGSVNANNSSTTVSFQWGLTVAYGNTIAAVPATVNGYIPTAVFADLTGLITDTVYHFRCMAVNGVGTSYGSDMTFTTGCQVPAAPGPITGPTSVCLGQSGILYSVSPIPNATNYDWTVPSGASITSGAGTPNILVDFSLNAISGDVTVTGTNYCASGPTGTLAVTMSSPPDPAGIITGTSELCAGTMGVPYSADPIANAIVYIWILPPGASIASGSGTNSIIVDFDLTASSGDITVYGNNLCGNGIASPGFPVTVNPIPATPIITYDMPVLFSDAPAGNQWYHDGALIPGATNPTYEATVNGWYWDVVTLEGCSSDTSNHIFVLLEGNESIPADATLSVFPSPNNGQFNIMLINQAQEVYTIRICNLHGAIIYETKEISRNGIFEKQIDLRPVASGMYAIVIINGGGHVVTRTLFIII